MTSWLGQLVPDGHLHFIRRAQEEKEKEKKREGKNVYQRILKSRVTHVFYNCNMAYYIQGMNVNLVAQSTLYET